MNPDKVSVNTHLKREKNISLHYAAGRPRERRGLGSASLQQDGTRPGTSPGHSRVHSTASLGTTGGHLRWRLPMGWRASRYPRPPPFPGTVSAVQQRDVGNEDAEEVENMKMFPTSVQFRFFNFQSQACSSSVFPCLQRANFSSGEGNR